MKGALAASKDRLWAYLIVPVMVLLLASTLASGRTNQRTPRQHPE